MRLRRGAACAVLAVVCALAAPARASETGGSMGGGDFSSTGTSYSGASSSYDSSSSSYSSSYSGGGSTGDLGADLIIALVALGISLVGAMIKQARSAPSYTPDYILPDTSMSYGNVADVTVLQVALDARARPFVQSELTRIAGIADTRTAEGRATMLREVALLLRRLRGSWVYGGAVNEAMTSLTEAQQIFHRHVDDVRARFKTEMFRNEQGVITRADAPELHPTSDDGPGLVLVTVVVAARHELFTVRHVADGEDLRKAFESLSSMIAGELVAVEIVWTPASPDERLSSIALEAAYPKPQLIPIAGSMVGKVYCEYCGAPYPAEAIACPSCGGRAKGAAA
jgi:uncharacterized membrane protein